MALERFIPKSPDMFIRNSQDFEVAKFGHLNTIVEYINNNSAKPAGLNGYVQFNDNSALGGSPNLVWNNSTNSLNIGSNAQSYLSFTYNPSNGSTYVGGINIYQDGVNLFPIMDFTRFGDTVFRRQQRPIFLYYTNENNGINYTNGQLVSQIETTGVRNGIVGSTLFRESVIYNGDGITRRGRYSYGVAQQSSFGGFQYVATQYGNLKINIIGDNASGYIDDAISATTAYNMHASNIINTTSNGSLPILSLDYNGLTKHVFQINGNVSFNNTADMAAIVGIKGSGSTSATTALLVQNSSSTTTFSVNDAGELSLGSTAPKITLGGNLTITSTVSPTREMVYDVINGNLSIYSGSLGEGYFIGNKLLTDRTSSTFVTPNGINAAGNALITAYDSNGNASINASNNGNRSIVLKGLGTSGAVLIGNITTGNGTSYDAILRADSTTQGFLPPRMTTAQRDAIASPATGLQVYNTTLGTLDIYDGTGWDRFGSQTLIKGSGSTSATTSLLVQNSAANNTLQVLDDAKVIVNGNNSSSGDNFRVNNSSGNYVMKTTNGYATQFGYFGAGDPVSIVDGSVNSAFRAGLPLISPSWYAGYFTCATGDVRIGQGITGTNANPSAILQANSTTQGFLPPRMTTSQRDAIVTPATGLRIYNTTTNTNDTYNGTAWQSNSVSGVAGAIQFSNGSAFASDATNFFWDNTNKRLGIGTTAPTSKLNIVDNVGGTGNALLISHPSAPGTLSYNPNASALTLSGGYSYLAINTFGGGANALILGSGGPQGYLDLKENGTIYTSLSGTSTGNSGYSYFLSQLGVGTATTLGAKLSIKGSGSTSATTSLLVQNSLGTTALQVTDDGNTSFTTASGGIVQIGSSTTSIFRIVNTYQRISIAPISVGGSISLNAGTEAGASYTANDNGHVFVYPNNRTAANTFTINREFFGNVIATTKTMLNITTSNATVLTNATLLRGVYFAPTTTDWPEIRAFESTSGGAYINTSSVSASAILQADSTTKGFLPPRMTTAEKNAIATPAAGLMVYDTTLNKLCVRTAAAWETITSV